MKEKNIEDIVKKIARSFGYLTDKQGIDMIREGTCLHLYILNNIKANIDLFSNENYLNFLKNSNVTWRCIYSLEPKPNFVCGIIGVSNRIKEIEIDFIKDSGYNCIYLGNIMCIPAAEV